MPRAHQQSERRPDSDVGHPRVLGSRVGTVFRLTVAIIPLAVIAAVLAAPPPASSAPDPPKVFAHYFPPYPISIDNERAENDYYARNYLRPSGEDGKHAEYGGLLRDRPRAVQVKESSSWEVMNQKIEITKAKRARLDGFVVDLLSAEGRNWESAKTLTRAAAQVGDFHVVPMVDATASFVDQSPSAAAAKIAVLLERSASYRSDDGYLLSSFAAERKPVSWWRSVISHLEGQHGLPISFQAVFLDASQENMDAFMPIADGFGNWGTRTVESIGNQPDYADRAHARGKTWMAPVAMQDYRPRSETYAETSNTAAFRTMWADARSDEADMVQVVTWNDYSESTQIAPSVAHGDCFVDLTRYYGGWFSQGSEPTIKRDAIYLTHRIQRVSADTRYQHQLASPDLGGSDTDPRNAVEVLLFVTEPATVVAQVGGQEVRYEVDPGVRVQTFDLRNGQPSVELRRGGEEVLSLQSEHRVISNPKVQDLQYYASCTRPPN